MDFVSSCIRDVKFSLDDDLHLVVGVGVCERSSLLLAVETSRDWGFVIWTWLDVRELGGTGAGDVAEEGVVSCNERRRVGLLDTGQMCEWLSSHGGYYVRNGSFAGVRDCR